MESMEMHYYEACNNGVEVREKRKKMKKSKKEKTSKEARGEIWDSKKTVEVDKRLMKAGQGRKEAKKTEKKRVASTESKDRREPKKKKKKAKKKNEYEYESSSDDGVDVKCLDGSIPGLVSLTNGENEYLVDGIVARSYKNDQLFYEVKWVGWQHRHNTIEPVSNLKHCKQLIREFEDKVRCLKILSKNVRFVPPPPPPPPQIDEAESITFDLTKVKIEMSECENIEEIDSACLTSVKCEGFNETKYRVVLANDNPDAAKGNDDEVEVLVIDYDIKDRDDEVGDLHEKSDKALWGNAYPMFRREWKQEEIPLRVVGSNFYRGTLVHLVRLKTASDPEMKHPFDVKQTNSVFVLNDVFKYKFPALLIEYYESNLVLAKSNKTEEETTEEAARQCLLHSLFKANVDDANFTKLYNDMMPSELRLSKEEVMKQHKYERSYLASQRMQAMIENEINLPRSQRKDRFGLPDYYGETDESEEDFDSDSSDDSDAWVPVPIQKPPSRFTNAAGPSRV